MAARTQVTLAQFQTLVYNRLGGNTAFWTSSEVTMLINAALRTWNSLTGYWHTRALVNFSAEFPYVALPAALVFGAHIELVNTPLLMGSVFGWDQDDPNWEARRGTPTEWSPVGIGIVALRPVPATAGQIQVDGLAVTPVLVNAGDFIDIGQEEFNVLLDYIYHLASFKEGGQEFASTLSLYKQFIAMAATQNEKLRASSLYRRVMGVDESLQEKPWRRKGTQEVVGVR